MVFSSPRALKAIAALCAVLAIPSLVKAEAVKPILNIQTGRPDYITAITTNTIVPGTGVTITCVLGACTVNSTGGGGGSSSLAVYNGQGIQVSSPTAVINFDPTNFTGSLTGGATALMFVFVPSSGVVYGSSTNTLKTDAANFRYAASSHTLIIVPSGDDVPAEAFQFPVGGGYGGWGFYSSGGTRSAYIRGSNTNNNGAGNLGRKIGLWFEGDASGANRNQDPLLSLDFNNSLVTIRSTGSLVFVDGSNSRAVTIRSSNTVLGSWTWRLPDQVPSTGTFMRATLVSSVTADSQWYDLFGGTQTWTAPQTLNSVTTATGTYVSSATVTFDEYANGNSSTGQTIDWTKSNKQSSTLTGSVTYAFIPPPHSGNLMLRVATGAGSFTAAWPAAVLWPSGTVPTITATPSKNDIVSCFYSDQTLKYYCQAAQNF